MSENVQAVEEKRGLSQHWPVALLALAVVLIFAIAMMTFQVKETEYAVVKTLGKAKVDEAGQIITYEPGLHFKWPFVDQVWRHDKRLQCYELTKGQIEQITTKDQYQIVVSTYILWKVGDPGLFMKRFKTTSEAEKKLDSLVRTSRNTILPQHNFSDLIAVRNTSETAGLEMERIEKQMLEAVGSEAMKEYGIEVARVGFRQLGFPESVTTKVFDRMTAERRSKSEALLANGNSEALRIRSDAERKAAEILAVAEAEAKEIRGQGDEEAAKHYAVFKENPELAMFLRNLDALKETLSDKDTLILDTNTPPFHLLKPGAMNIKANEGAQSK